MTLVALSTLALAQTPPALQCKPTETQPECHARLKCKANEELEDCQKRLQKDGKDGKDGNAGNAGNAGQRDDANRNNDNARDADQGRRRDDQDTGRGRDNARDNSDRENDQRRSRQRGDRQGERRRGARSSSKGFEANKIFGVGLELGEPTGLTGKYFLSDASALDFGIGWIYSHYYYGDGLHLYADYLYHPTSLVSSAAFELPLYIGVGLRFWDFNYCDNRVCNYDGSAIGIRIPFGIAFDFNNVPLDIFIQLVPVIDFVNGDYYDRYRDRAHFGVDFSFGLRYWFK
ncbi:MAG: DUF3996 domain-containing protein [Deltaproteobacteria bacterium]|nr:DUF3996 domain-containing protein [Deltaproteobacteria bacterium]